MHLLIIISHVLSSNIILHAHVVLSIIFIDSQLIDQIVILFCLTIAIALIALNFLPFWKYFQFLLLFITLQHVFFQELQAYSSLKLVLLQFFSIYEVIYSSRLTIILFIFEEFAWVLHFLIVTWYYQFISFSVLLVADWINLQKVLKFVLV